MTKKENNKCCSAYNQTKHMSDTLKMEYWYARLLILYENYVKNK